MLHDRTERISVDEAFSELEDRTVAAEGHAYNVGQQAARLWYDGLIVDAMHVSVAALHHRKQFGPWYEKRLLESFCYGIRSITRTVQ